MVPHSLTCAVLKRFSSIKCDSSMESVVRMCLDAMALQLLNTQAGAAALADHPSFSKTSLYDAECNEHNSQANCTDQGATKTPQRPSTTRLPLHLQQIVSELRDDQQPQQQQQAEQGNADSQQPLQQLGNGSVAQQRQDQQQQQQQVQQSGGDPHQIQRHHGDSQPEGSNITSQGRPGIPLSCPSLPIRTSCSCRAMLLTLLTRTGGTG
ncbi:TPA: hypothetical protein ACH3X2_010329 [Trebouxia sp. C0005]